MKQIRTLRNTALVLTSGAMLFFASCAKNKDAVSPDKVTIEDALSLTIPNGDSATLTSNGSQGKIYNNNGEYLVKNFKQAYSTGPGQPADGNFYWNFDDNDAANPSTYNIKFSGIATGDLRSNDEFRFVDIDFDDVVYADWSSGTDPQPSSAGTDVIGMNNVTGTSIPGSVLGYANNAGWYTYNWSTGHTVSPVAGRTLLWKSGSDIYKFEIISIYQNLNFGGVFPYYTFRYKAL